MNLKDAFRYQNFLDRLLNQALTSMTDSDNLLETTKIHRRSKAISDLEDETEVTEVTDFVSPEKAINLALKITEEREALTRAIGDAKEGLAISTIDMDAAIEANKYRQSVAENIRRILKTKAGKKIELGTGYTFNSEGNQVPYYYDIEITTKEMFARAKLKTTMQELLAKADQVSSKIDEAMVNTGVNYVAPWDVNESFEDIIAQF